jgi:hypothetical protein
MENTEKEQMSQLEREKAVFLYSAALERGDFETVAVMLEEAQHDAALEQMILEVNEVFGTEHDRSLSEEIVLAADAAQVREILRDCMPSAIQDVEQEAMELPPLTVRGVLAQMQEDSTLNPHIRQEVSRVQQTLRQEADVLLPGDLSQRNVRQFFGEIGVSVGEHLQKMFRQAAIFLSMGREQDMAQLAATRRQRERRTTNLKEQGEE